MDGPLIGPAAGRRLLASSRRSSVGRAERRYPLSRSGSARRAVLLVPEHPQSGTARGLTASSGDNRSMASRDLLRAADAIAGLGAGGELTARIGAIEASLTGKERRAAQRTIAKHEIDEALLKAHSRSRTLRGRFTSSSTQLGFSSRFRTSWSETSASSPSR